MDTSTVIALAAFVTALLTLYLGLLRPAEIEIQRSASANELPVTMSGPWPAVHQLRLRVYAINFGAHSGVLERATARWIGYRCHEPAFWSGGGNSVVFQADFASGLSFPLPLQPSDVTVFGIKLDLAPTVDENSEREEWAHRIGGLSEIEVEIEWTFVRAAGLPFSARRLPTFLRRHRAEVTRVERLVVDASRYRQQVIDHWRTRKEWQALADRAEKRDT